MKSPSSYRPVSSFLPLHLAPRRLALALAAASLAGLGVQAQAAATLPSGLQVVQGQATQVVNGSKLTVTNSNGAILNWNSFSIGAQNAVNFVQPDSASQVLNRVTGNDPSQILGQLSSNGRVWLLNPNGVLFGQGARVDVAGLVTSTLNLNDQDWSAGRYVFTTAGNPSASAIVNQGEIRSTSGGQVLLLAGAGGVRNEGLIDTQGGQIVLAAGSSIELLDTATPRFTVKVTAPAGEVLNLGQLNAAGGRIDVQAATVNQQGIVRADSLAVGPAGEIVINAGERLTLAGGSVTSADGAATTGGRIQLLGHQVALLDGSSVSADGAAGGGTVLVGGGAQGRDASVPNADAVFFAPGASIRADSTLAGDGGHIVLWGDTATRAYGALSATGGPQGGQGGLIETSGGWLDARPSKVDVSAAHGASGTWLLDPHDLLISDASSDTTTSSGDITATTFTAGVDSATLSTGTIISALNAGTNVTISTAGPGGSSQTGNIDLGTPSDAANIIVNAASPGALNLVADGNITVWNATVSSNNGKLNVSMLAGATSSSGFVDLHGATITTRGGNVTLGGNASGALPQGGTFSNAASGGVVLSASTSINAGTALGAAGAISIQGVQSNSATGVTVQGSSLQGGSILLNGASAAGQGVSINGSTLTTTGSLTIQGAGGNLTSGAEGVLLTGSSVTASPGTFSSGSTLTIAGSSTGASVGANIQPDSGGVIAGNGTAMNLYGATTINGGNALSMNGTFTSSGAMTITSAGTNPVLTLNGGAISSPTSVLLTGAGTLTDNVATISSNHLVKIEADNLTLNAATITSSQPTGDGILLYGNGSQGMASFTNNSGSTLNAGSARWVVWSQDIANPNNFKPGTLPYDFTRYSATAPAAWAADAGNAYVSTSSETAFLNGTGGSKIYDGTRTATVSNLSITPSSGIYGGPGSGSFTSTPSVQFASKDVGYGAINLVDPTVASFLDSNSKPVYGLTIQSSMFEQISPATLTIPLVAHDKVYDGLSTGNVSVGTVTGLVNGESLTISGVGNFDDKNVGTAKNLAAHAVVADGPNGELASNYSFNQGSTLLTASITAAPLNITGLTANNKVYNGNTNAFLSGTASISPISGDSVSLSGSATGTFTSRNVGTAIPVTLSGLTLTGTDKDNYSLTSSLSADITPLNLLVSGLSAQSRVYNATTVAGLTGTPTLSAAIPGDSVSVQSGYAGSFATKNVGSAKPVQVTGLVLGGTDAGNYTVSAPTGLVADITPLALSITGLSASNKVYDTTVTASLSGTATVAALGSDQVTVSGSAAQATFGNKNVGSAKPVTVSGFTLTGGDAGNYTIAQPAGLAADITPAPLVVTGLTASNKVYDTTVAASLSGTAAVTALGSDAVSLSGTAQGAFADKNVGNAKPVGLTGLTLTGADAGNYTLTLPTGLSANITPAFLTLTGLSANNKVYDGTNVATMAGTPVLQNVLGSDQVGLTGTAIAQFSDVNVGTGINVDVTGGLALTGADQANYRVTRPTFSANITPATLSYVADAVSKPLNEALPALTGNVSGFVNGETASSATSGSLSFTTAATAASPQGSYAVNGQGLSARNYQFVQAPGNATALTVTSPTTAPPPPLLDQASTVALTAATASTTPTSTTVPANTTVAIASLNASRSTSGMLDLTQAPATAPAPASSTSTTTTTTTAASATPAAAATAFAPVRLSGLSMDALAALLANREHTMNTLLSDANSKLQQNPALADAHVCQSLKEAESGTCLITAALKRESQAEGRAEGVAMAPAPAPVQAQPAAPVVASAEPPAPRWLNLPARRAVRQAALPQIERKIAVVIGVDDYQDKTIPTLGNAVNDAQALGQLFETRLGYETVVIPNASKAAVIGTLNRLALTVGPKDSVVIYYAGHGDLVESTKQGYWLLSDADAKKPETWLSNGDIGRLIQQIGASQVALISDSCYSGSLVSDERIRPTGTTVDPAQLLQRKSVVVMSSGGNEPVSDAGKQGHSPFTWNLLNQLGQVNQWQPGGNVFERVRFAVAKELPQRPQYGASSAAGHQSGGDYLFEQRQLDGSKL